MSQSVRFNPDALRLMAERVLLLELGDVCEVRVIGTKGAEFSGYFDNAEDLLREVERLTKMRGVDSIYTVLNRPDPRLLARYNNRLEARPKTTTSDNDIAARRWILVDIDVDRPSGISASDQERETSRNTGRAIFDYLKGEGFPGASLATMTSGNGFYVLVRVDLPVDPASESLCKRFLQALATRFDCSEAHIDQKCFNASRIAALCGTLKGKGDSTEERPHRLVMPIRFPEFPVPATLKLLEKVAGAAPEPVAKPRESYSQEGAIVAPFDMLRFTMDNGIEVLDTKTSGGYERYYITCPFDASHTGTDAYLAVQPSGAPMFSCSHNSCRGNRWRELIERTGWKTPRTIEREQTRQGNLAASVRPESYQPAPTTKPKPAQKKPVPDIELWEKQLWEKSEEAMAALAESNNVATPRVFVKQGQLTRVGSDAEGRLYAQPLTLDSTRGIMARCANWWTMTAKGDAKATTPPEDVIRDILSAPDLWEGIPVLDTLTFTPVLTKNTGEGTNLRFELVTRAGYYRASRLLFHDADNIESELGDTSPTPENVSEALRLFFDELLGDFPFKDQASRAHALALALLPIVRLAIVGPTPFHMVRASTPGTGKSLLVETLTSIVVPGGASASPCPGSDRDLDEEMRKRITTTLMRGSSHVWLDNIKRHLDSPSLALALTQTIWSDRALGGNTEVNLPVRCVWVGTGNNPTISDELWRRTVFITLDANMERPWDRERFKIDDIKGYVAERRGKLVGALLTLVRAWIESGCPHFSGKRLGSFDNWSRVMGGILETVGVAGFLSNREAGDQADPDRARWVAFLSSWHGEFGEEPCGVGDVAARAVEADIIVEDTVKEKQKLGYRLRQHLDRVFDDLRLELAPTDNHSKTARYRVVRAEGLFSEGSILRSESLSGANPGGSNLHPAGAFAGNGQKVRGLSENVRGLSGDLLKVPANTNADFPSTEEDSAGTCGDLRGLSDTRTEKKSHGEDFAREPAETPRKSPQSPQKEEKEENIDRGAEKVPAGTLTATAQSPRKTEQKPPQGGAPKLQSATLPAAPVQPQGPVEVKATRAYEKALIDWTRQCYQSGHLAASSESQANVWAGYESELEGLRIFHQSDPEAATAKEPELRAKMVALASWWRRSCPLVAPKRKDGSRP